VVQVHLASATAGTIDFKALATIYNSSLSLLKLFELHNPTFIRHGSYHSDARASNNGRSGNIGSLGALCRGLRFVRREEKHALFPYKTREDFKKMTTEDAFEIVRYVQGLEFPFLSGKALAFALFK
jgi:hypothetical protein